MSPEISQQAREMLAAFQQVERGAIRQFAQPHIMSAVFVECRQRVAVPLPDMLSAIEAALALTRIPSDGYGRGRLDGIGEKAFVYEHDKNLAAAIRKLGGGE